MPKKNTVSKTSSIDIFQILKETTAKEKKKRKEELLREQGVEEFFVKGGIIINKRTCQGLECKLCIEACPTKALFWRRGEVGISEELCIYCGACVLSCIVDDCIKITRKRKDGKVESFSKPRGFIVLQHNINTRKRFERICNMFPKPEDYLKRYKLKS